jgi:hypothetical protein
MAYTTYLGSDGIFKIHRTGCTATDGCYVESVQHVYHETYDTMREAVYGILDAVCAENSTAGIDASPCCNATDADFEGWGTAYRIVSPARSRFARRN